MGMKKGALVSSIATIVLCAGLITGSTWAAFTSVTNTSLVVSSANVNVVAAINEQSKALINEDPNNRGFFINGGTVTITGNNQLELKNITPGDGVTFDVELANSSNIKVSYRVVVKSVGGDSALAEALEVEVTYGNGAETVTGTENGGYLTIDPPQNPNEFTTATIKVSVKFKDNLDNNPNDDYDPYKALQGKATTVQVIVEAVQANGAT